MSMNLGVCLSQNKAYRLQKPINKATTEAQNKTVQLCTKHQPVNSQNSKIDKNKNMKERTC